ncbi:MAG TPA: 16S rRNA (guanine(966)-N(2))-methyltransferase RsmD [Rudaea sp.]|jgi:16S rRNA (guanine966-N2)-methyltransferase|nr:16S rRNA (guanine(966)-N(2))-methyltransferase RsmD [Rudaea sp.]
MRACYHSPTTILAKPRTNATPGRIRIIGGSLRGSKLEVPDAPGLRPTPDRIRETLFNWLMPVIDGARCLDLFAGTGALGIEALSRGAAHVDFVETDVQLARLLRDNLARLFRDDLARAKELASVHQSAASRFLESAGSEYDIVFLDPPFGEDVWDSAAAALESHRRLAPGAWIYVESPADRGISLPDNWIPHREGRAGAVRFALYRRD